jgi:hypothetical protein
LTKAKSEYSNALGDYNINYAKLQRAMGTILVADKEDLKKTDSVFLKRNQLFYSEDVP